MSVLKGRLRRLEAAKSGGPCRECKLPPDGPGYVVLADGPDVQPLDREGRPVDPDERCPRCGRLLRFVIRVMYEDAPPPGTAGERWP